MVQGKVRPSYNEIKDYIRVLLQAIKDGKNTGPLESFNSVTREVFIKSYTHNLSEARKVYEIPNPKEEPIRFRSVWVDVFMACLDYYEKKLIKDGIDIKEDGELTVNGKVYVCNNALEHIALFKQISDELDKLKHKKEVTPIISKQSVVVGPTSFKNDYSLKDSASMERTSSVIDENPRQKLINTFPKGVYPVSSVKRENDVDPNYDMALAHSKKEGESVAFSKPVSKKAPRKVTNYETYNYLQKERGSIPLVGHDILTKEEAINLKEHLLVFISGSLDHKIETGFYENCELLKGVLTAAFITGKAVNPDKILKEAIKLIKLSKCTNSGIICYEANSNQLTDVSDEKLFRAFDAMMGLAEILRGEGYIPLLCLDNDLRERLRKMDPDYKVTMPIISRVSSKELDGLRYDDDFIVMNSKNEYDELLLTSNTKKYISERRTVKTPSK